MKKNFLTNLFSSFKKKPKKGSPNTSINEKNTSVEQQNNPQSDVVEYHETLYSDRPAQQFSKPRYDHKLLFTDVQSVESDIDDIDKEKNVENGNIEKKVDLLIEKKKKSVTTSKPTRKKPNVIYVVSKPQPGQVKGDWAVRSHYKIFSHHRTKLGAIQNARKIALEKDATVLVQNMDGTFSEGFKPRKQK